MASLLFLCSASIDSWLLENGPCRLGQFSWFRFRLHGRALLLPFGGRTDESAKKVTLVSADQQRRLSFFASYTISPQTRRPVVLVAVSVVKNSVSSLRRFLICLAKAKSFRASTGLANDLAGVTGAPFSFQSRH